MLTVPTFSAAISTVTAWLDGLGPSAATRCPDKESEQRCRVWRLAEGAPVLHGAAPLLVLQHDFPLTPARIELDRKFCLQLLNERLISNILAQKVKVWVLLQAR